MFRTVLEILTTLWRPALRQRKSLNDFAIVDRKGQF